MTRNLEWALLGFGGLAMAAAGCDSQAGSGYRGEPLMEIHGSALVTLGSNEQAYSPALVFQDREEHANLRYVVDMDVDGEFPSSFSGRVYEPPPAATMMDYVDSGVGYAVGYVGAVPREHQPVLEFSEHELGGSSPVDGGYEHLHTWHKKSDPTRSYEERWLCPTADLDEWPEGCTLSAAVGDESLRQGPWDIFAGLSEDYLVVYLDKDLPGTSYLAHSVGSGAGLRAGYHLMHVRPTTPQERAAAAECNGEADALATERFEALHGAGAQPDFSNPADDYFALQDDALVELECGLRELVVTPVDSASEDDLVIRLGQDLSWAGF